MNAESMRSQIVEMIRGVGPQARFEDVAFTAAWLVLVNRDELLQVSDSDAHRCQKVLEAYLGNDYGPLVDYAQWQAGVLEP